MTTSPKYTDLTDAAGTINERAVAAMADARAHREIEACAKIGWTRKFETVREQELTYVRVLAETRRDSIIAASIRASLSPTEQQARTLELGAELAETAIPPRKAEAARLRERAAALRTADQQAA